MTQVTHLSLRSFFLVVDLGLYTHFNMIHCSNSHYSIKSKRKQQNTSFRKGISFVCQIKMQPYLLFYFEHIRKENTRGIDSNLTFTNISNLSFMTKQIFLKNGRFQNLMWWWKTKIWRNILRFFSALGSKNTDSFIYDHCWAN